MRHVSSYKRQTRPTGGSAIHKDATASISPTIPYTVGCCMESTLVRTGFTPWKALRSGPSHRQRQTVSLCEQLNVHACAADRLSISFHSRRSGLSWAYMWWTSMPGQGWHHGASTLSMRLHGPYLFVHMLQVVTMSAIPVLSPSFTFPVISPAGTNPPDKSATVPSQMTG